MTMRHTNDQVLQAVIDALPTHIAVLDQSGAIIAVNAAWHRFAQANGYVGDGSGLGLNYLDVCWRAAGPEAADARAVERGIRAVLAGEQAEFRHHYTGHGPDEPRWFQLRAARLAADQSPGAIVTHENITQSQQRDTLAPRSEVDRPPISEGAAPRFDPTSTRLQALFDQAHDAFLLLDDQGCYVDANMAACTLTGYSRSELLRLSIFDLAAPAAHDNQSRVWNAFIDLGTRFGEFMLLRKDGSGVLIEFYAMARITPGVHLSVLRDITARRQAEDGLRQHVEHLNILHGIDQNILAAGSLKEVGQAALIAIHQLIPNWRGSLLVFDFETICGQSIQLAISDDGVGFNADAVRHPNQRSSLGLMTMQERVEAFGGRLLIEAAPGPGTRIIVELAG
jgi:PAS domain S-box-containing protein